ncbi:hypothetical protein QBC39DRAFT_436947 [Podospora conica]|nr:hypothetical protein QBC39DRAFT_436947 [Schizothecium conicum]
MIVVVMVLWGLLGLLVLLLVVAVVVVVVVEVVAGLVAVAVVVTGLLVVLVPVSLLVLLPVVVKKFWVLYASQATNKDPEMVPKLRLADRFGERLDAELLPQGGLAELAAEDGLELFFAEVRVVGQDPGTKGHVAGGLGRVVMLPGLGGGFLRRAGACDAGVDGAASSSDELVNGSVDEEGLVGVDGRRRRGRGCALG